MVVSICIVGASGLIGKRHLQHVTDEPRANLTAIVDPVALPTSSDVKRFDTLGAMLEARSKGELQVDGAILATPNHTHVPLALELLKHGVHALVEKPVSTDTERGAELVKAEQSASAQVLVGHHRRFNPYITKSKELLADQSRFGKMLAIQGVWATLKPLSYYEPPTAWRKDPKSGGVILINLVHDIDLLRYLAGADVERVFAELGASTRSDHPVEETGAVTLRFSNGIVGTFIFSDAAASPWNFECSTGENPTIPKTSQPCYQFLGTRGSFSLPQLELWRYKGTDNDDVGCWTDAMSPEAAVPVGDTAPFTSQLRHFCDVCEGKDKPRCSATEAWKSIATLEAIIESLRTSKPVQVRSSP